MTQSILLDTHVWIWHVNGSTELKKSTNTLINQAMQENVLYLSAISVWEFCMLEAKKRIISEIPCLEWINHAIQLLHLRLLPLTPTISVESCNLPGEFHEDPADRMIVATARVENLKLLTRDKKILDYSKKKYVSALSA